MLMGTGKLTGPQPYTEEHKQLRKAEEGETVFPGEDTAISQPIHRSDITQTEQAIFRNMSTYTYMHITISNEKKGP